MSARTIFRKKNTIFSSDIRREFRNNFDIKTRYKNLLKNDMASSKFKKIIIKGPNLYRSFINASTPYNYLQVPSEKNTFLVCFNGGPKVYSYAEKDKMSKELDKKEIIYGEKKDCGCFTKLYVPKLTRCYSNLENYRSYITMNNYFQRPKTVNKNNFVENPLNTNRIGRAFTPNPAIFGDRPGTKRIGLAQKLIKDRGDYNNFSTNFSDTSKLNIENNKIGFNEGKVIKRNKKYDTLFYTISQKIDKKFHKTQIFNNCKPFLMEGM